MDEYLSRNKKVVSFCLVVAINLLVKIVGISHNPIALDEPFSIYHSQFSINHIYQILSEGNNPPLYEFFLHYWISIGGTDAFWVRLPSVIFSSLASGFWFMAALHCMGLWYAVGCTVLFTFSTEYIYFSHEARAYAMLLMVLAISSYLVIRVWNGEKKKSILLAAAFFSALSIYVHYLAAFPVAMMGLVTIAQWVHKKNRGLMYYLLFTLLLVIPIGILLFERIQAINVHSVWGSKPAWTQLYGFLNIFLNGRITFAVLLLCILAGVVFSLSQKNGR
jgi:mannosyltransferase